MSALAEGGGSGSPRSGETKGVSVGAEGASWSSGPTRGANAPAGAAGQRPADPAALSEADRLRGMQEMSAKFAEAGKELYVCKSGDQPIALVR
jgi:hypothetical protein